MEELSRDAPLFEGRVPFKRAGVTSDLTVRVLEGVKSSSKASHVLCVEVTDERDSFFLHSLTIGEAEFAPLREEQSLRVDFARFPLKLIELLRLCVHEPARFYCALATARDSPAGSPSTLSVVEVNPFKELTHITLSLRCGNDAAIKRYLAARLAQTQAALSVSEASLCAVQRDMVAGQDAARDAAAELVQLRTSREMEAQRAAASAAAALSDAMRGALRDKAAGEAALLEELSATRARFEAQGAALRKRTDEAVAGQAVAAGSLAAVEAALRELQVRQRSLEAAAAVSAEEATVARAASAAAIAERTDSEKALVRVSQQAAVLGQQVSDLRELVAATGAQLKTVEGAKAQLEDTVAQYKDAFTKQHLKLERMEGEIHKANSLIDEKQEQLKEAKAKIKSKGEAARAAEDRLTEKERALAAYQRENESLRMALEKERLTASGQEASITAMKRQLADARESLEKDQQVIAWLNKEITDISTPPPAAASKPSARYTALPSPASAQRPAHVSSASFTTPLTQASRSALTLTGNPVAGSAPTARCALADFSTNPYLSGTIPLSAALKELQGREAAKSSYFTQDPLSPVPGGGPV